jgi:hypothetical protein
VLGEASALAALQRQLPFECVLRRAAAAGAPPQLLCHRPAAAVLLSAPQRLYGELMHEDAPWRRGDTAVLALPPRRGRAMPLNGSDGIQLKHRC